MEDQPDERPAHWFKPGESGNPLGRPKGPTAIGVLRALLSEAHESGKTKLEAFWLRVYQDAMAGEAAAQRLIADRIAPLKLILEGSEDGAPIVRVFTSGAVKAEQGVIDVEGTRRRSREV